MIGWERCNSPFDLSKADRCLTRSLLLSVLSPSSSPSPSLHVIATTVLNHTTEISKLFPRHVSMSLPEATKLYRDWPFTYNTTAYVARLALLSMSTVRTVFIQYARDQSQAAEKGWTSSVVENDDDTRNLSDLRLSPQKKDGFSPCRLWMWMTLPSQSRLLQPWLEYWHWQFSASPGNLT